MIKGNIMDSIDSDIALESVQLPNFEHKDPSDRFIIATARVLNCELMTHDQKLVAYSKQGHVNIKWLSGITWIAKGLAIVSKFNVTPYKFSQPRPY